MGLRVLTRRHYRSLLVYVVFVLAVQQMLSAVSTHDTDCRTVGVQWIRQNISKKLGAALALMHSTVNNTAAASKI